MTRPTAPARIFAARKVILRSRRFFSFPGGYLLIPTAILASRVVISRSGPPSGLPGPVVFWSGPPSWLPERSSFFPKRHLSSGSLILAFETAIFARYGLDYGAAAVGRNS